MADDDRSTRPPQAGLSEEGADVGGIPSTLNQGVDHASDRAGGRREGTLESDAGGAIPPSLPVSPDSAALSSRPARDKSAGGVPTAGRAGTRAEAGSAGGEDTRGRPDTNGSAGGHARPSNAGDSGNDDSLPESLGKAIAEPFKRD